MEPALELVLDRDEENGRRILLRSPEVGLFTRALPEGALLAPGATAGALHSLGRCFELRVPPGASGRIVNPRPERVLEPVGFGTVLYRLSPLQADAASGASTAGARAETGTGALLFRAPYSGRFWHRPAPGEPPFLAPGDLLADGQTLGLIEVMKTFAQLVYRPGSELPARARVLRYLVADGGEVKDGGALLELERA